MVKEILQNSQRRPTTLQIAMEYERHCYCKMQYANCSPPSALLPRAPPTPPNQTNPHTFWVHERKKNSTQNIASRFEIQRSISFTFHNGHFCCINNGYFYRTVYL